MQSAIQEAFKDNQENSYEISFGEFIKQKRKYNNITITDMLKLLENVKASEYTRIEEGLLKPDGIIIEKISRILKLSQAEIKVLDKLKIRSNVEDYSDSSHELRIAARRVNKK